MTRRAFLERAGRREAGRQGSGAGVFAGGPLLLLAIPLLFPAFLGAQVTAAWVARYSGPGIGFDSPTAIAVDSGGNVYVTGYSPAAGYEDYATVKYDAAGNELWMARYDGSGGNADYARDLCLDLSGNLYVTGSSGYDYTTIKYSPGGDTAWTAHYRGSGQTDNAVAITADPMGNIYVTGGSYQFGTYDDYATIKYDPMGIVQWVARYNGPGGLSDLASAIAVDSVGNAYVTGQSAGSDSSQDYATVKYDPEGRELWVARYDGPGNGTDIAAAIAVDGMGNVYVTGWGDREGGGANNDYATIKYDPDGRALWVARYDGPGSSLDQAYAMALDGAGNIYVTGNSYGVDTNSDYATIKYDPEGNELWVARHNGPADEFDRATALAVDGEGNVYVTGDRTGVGTNSDFATIKYDAQGNEVWVARYNGPGNSDDRAVALALDGEGNVYVTGWSYGSVATYYDYATIKYRQEPVGIAGPDPGGPEVPRAVFLGQNSPNPFNPSTLIRYSVPAAPSGDLGASREIPGEAAGSGKAGATSGMDVTLSVFNVRGQRVATLVRERQGPGEYSGLWDGRSDSGAPVPSGVYFYRLEAGSFTATRKMILLE